MSTPDHTPEGGALGPDDAPQADAPRAPAPPPQPPSPRSAHGGGDHGDDGGDGPEDDAPQLKRTPSGGVLAWFAKNPVAANLFMILLMAGGLAMAGRIQQEVFPEVELDSVSASVAYPGASPAEVEQGVILAIEEAVRGVDGVKRVTSTAQESSGAVNVELLLGTDRDRALADVKASVDRIVSFPEEAERPVVSLVEGRREVISAVIHGDVEEKTLWLLAERIRDDLLNSPEITQVDLLAARPLEVSIEVPQSRLRAYGLTLDQISAIVRMASIELPGGSLDTQGGEILVRTSERKDTGRQFEEIVVLTRPDGTRVRLGDLATIIDGFRDVDIAAVYEGKRAIMVRVYRVGDQTPLDVAAAVKDYAEDKRAELPPGVGLAIWSDRSEIYRQRIDLLLNNAYIGLILVFGALGLFLNFRLAFWVTMGIPISFLGAMLLLPIADASINMISLFAFIVVLGMVVDDAIVVGENIYSMRQKGLPYMEAAVQGVKEIAVPVTFSVTTTMVAFSPMFFVPGTLGKIFQVIPTIVIAVLLLSLFESLFILPAHLAHGKESGETGLLAVLERGQSKFANGLERFIKSIYVPAIRAILPYRYLAMAVGVALLFMSAGLVASGKIPFSFFPKIDGDVITARARLPVGSPMNDTRALQRKLEQAAREVLKESGGMEKSRGLYTQIGTPMAGGGPAVPTSSLTGAHILDMSVYLVGPDDRDFNAEDFTERWRKKVGEVPGLDSLTFAYNIGPSAGNPIDIQLSHPDNAVLEAAARDVAERLKSFAGVTDIEDGISEGKEQFDFRLKPAARTLGLTETDLARQLRASFFGAEALRQQRGRHEVRVLVRLPEQERDSVHAIERLLLRSPQGGEITLGQAATLERGRAYTVIKRVDGRRVLNVTADLAAGGPTANEVLRDVGRDVMPEILAKYDGLSYSLEGEQREQRDTLGALQTGALLALMIIFALLAIPFKSYVQPLIIMSAIPFGLVGAVLGHLIMGLELSLMSMMGIVALSGIVVNDSLVLIVTINEMVDRGVPLLRAVVEGGASRFRPILLTTITTFLGLAPMVLETSVQARFLIPMAVSLAFGVVVATGIILILVPCSYVIIEDIQKLLPGFQARSEASHDDHDAEAPPTASGLQGSRL